MTCRIGLDTESQTSSAVLKLRPPTRRRFRGSLRAERDARFRSSPSFAIAQRARSCGGGFVELDELGVEPVDLAAKALVAGDQVVGVLAGEVEVRVVHLG